MNESYYRQKQNTFHDRALIALYLHRDRRHIRANIIQINSIQICLWRIKPEQPSRSTVSLYACGQCECKSLFLGTKWIPHIYLCRNINILLPVWVSPIRLFLFLNITFISENVYIVQKSFKCIEIKLWKTQQLLKRQLFIKLCCQFRWTILNTLAQFTQEVDCITATRCFYSFRTFILKYFDIKSVWVCIFALICSEDKTNSIKYGQNLFQNYRFNEHAENDAHR